MIGNNPLVNILASYRNFNIQQTPLIERKNYRGANIREAMLYKSRWQNLVPEYLVDYYDGLGIENRITALNGKDY